MARLILILFVLALGAPSFASPFDLSSISLSDSKKVLSIWKGRAHPTVFVDEIFVSQDLKQRVFVKHKVPRNKKLLHDVWFDSGKGRSIHLSRGRFVTAIYVEGIVHPRELLKVFQYFQKQRTVQIPEFDSLVFPKACAELTGRNLGPPSVQRARAIREESRNNINFLQCLGEGVLAGLQGFADSVASVGRWLRTLFTDPGEAWRQVSEGFQETLDFVLNIRTHFSEFLQEFREMSPEVRTLLLCELAGQVISTVGVGALLGVGAAAAFRQLAPMLQRMMTNLRNNRGVIERLAVASMSDADRRAMIRRVVNGDPSEPGRMDRLRTEASLLRPGNNMPGDLTDADLPRSPNGEVDPSFFTERMDELGLRRQEGGDIDLTEAAANNPFGRALLTFRANFNARIIERPDGVDGPLYEYLPDGSVAVYIDRSMLARPGEGVRNLRRAQAALEFDADLMQRHGFRLDAEGRPVITTDSPTGAARLIQRLERELGARGANVEVRFTDEGLAPGVAGDATTSRFVRIRPYYLERGFEGDLMGVLHHEITHTTTYRGGQLGQMGIAPNFAAAPVYAGREMFFQTGGRFNVNQGYATGFRADEVEARVRQMAVLQRQMEDPSLSMDARTRAGETWGRTRGETVEFIEEQREMVQAARDLDVSEYTILGGRTVRLDVVTNGRTSRIEIDLRAFGSFTPDDQVYARVQQILATRLGSLDNAQRYLERHAR